MVQKFKLIYFNGKWLGEPIRYILSYAGEDFEDVRLDWNEWEKNPEAFRPKYPYGKLPLLEENGVKISQSYAILRYLARKFDLAGKTPLEEAKADEYVDVVKDMLKDVEQMWTEDPKKKEDAKNNVLKVVFPRMFTVFEADLKNNGGAYLVGKSLTWADIILAHFSDLFENFVDSSILNNYPTIKQHQTQVLNLPKIKAWIDKRPVTEY